MKLGGIGHIPVGVFFALAAIIRALSTMPDRLGTMIGTQAGQATAGEGPTPADD